MSHNLAFDFAVDKSSNSITVSREFAAGRQLVWDAYTKSEILDRWWAPQPWKARTRTMDFSPGGYWHYAMVGPEGEEHWSYAEYLYINPIEQFTARDGFSDAEGNINTEMPQSEWDARFTDKGEATVVNLRITFSDLKQLEVTLQMGFKEGLTAAMEGLDDLLTNLNQ